MEQKEIKILVFCKFLIIVVFFFPLNIRSGVISFILGEQLGYTVAICLPIILLIAFIRNYKLNKLHVILAICAFLLLILTYLFKMYDFSFIKVITKFIPLLLIGITLKSKMAFENLFWFYLKCLNIIAVLLFSTWFIDYVLIDSKPIASTLIRIFNPYSIIDYDNRFYSFYTAPINTKSILLQIAATNLIYSIYYNKTKYFVLFIFIGLFGVLSAQSKAGIIIFIVILFTFLLIYKKNILYASSTVLFLTSSYYFGFFNMLIERYKNTTLTSGRNELLELAWQKSYYWPNFFIGYGEDFSTYYATNIIGWMFGFEYFPIISMYDYGILFTIIILFIMVIYPLFLLLKRKNIIFFFILLFIFIDLNTFNTFLATNSEMTLMYAILAMIVINGAKYKKSLI